MRKILIINAILLICSQLRAQSMTDYVSKFNPGHYYTLDGKRVDGEIKISCMAKFGTNPHNSIYFKVGNAKQERFTTKDITSFVIGTDSFFVAKNIEHGESKLTDDFVHFDSLDGDITTVTHYTTTGNEGATVGVTLYVKKGIAYISLKAAQKAK